jgi:flagellar basal-body rod protein FlgB
MSSSVDRVLQVALRDLNVRQQVTADNIANADTPGFKMRTVQFEDQLAWAMQVAPNDATLEGLAQPTIVEDPGRIGKMDQNSVDMDHELLTMTDTTLRYNIVAQVLSERLALYRSVLNDGRS